MKDGDIVSASIDHETDNINDFGKEVIRSVTRWTVTVTRAYPSYRPDQRTKVIARASTYEQALATLVHVTQRRTK